MTLHSDWNRFKRCLCECPELGMRLDVSRMNVDAGFFDTMRPAMASAFDAMTALEGGAIANPSEHRMVGHYWLRDARLAPDATVTHDIQAAVAGIRRFAAEVHDARIAPPKGDGFYVVLHVGIGGSALGPQLLVDALGTPDDPMILRFLDNTDPDGIARTLAEIGEALGQTLVVVASKSGGTKETRNGLIETQHAFRQAGLSFADHAVAITGNDSQLDRQARDEGWIRTFPIWDWVGGRTSITSACGLLPAALAGFNVDALLEGARACDTATRQRDLMQNPAALLALMWHHGGQGRGARDMVVLPYCDRLSLLGRYLQQLVMESLGKAHNRDGVKVEQGLSVYGNKGSTDQHAYVQQLRDGSNNFFATFVQVLEQGGSHVEVEPGITSGDYLNGFYLGTRAALTDNGRESMTITLDRLDAFTLGVLIALFERTVGLYAELINVNAYDQPGVEAGKKAAAGVLERQQRITAHAATLPLPGITAEAIAEALGDDAEAVLQVLQHLAATGRLTCHLDDGASVLTATYSSVEA